MKEIKLWLDLDENLVNTHTLFINSDFDEYRTKHPYEHYEFWLIDGCGYSMSRDHVISYLRPHAVEFVDKCIELFGKENVKILTQSTADYASRVTIKFFDIDRNYIVDRYDILMQKFAYEDCENALVDNLPVDHYNSQGKLKYLGGDVKYIKSEEFNIHTDFDFDHKGEFDRIYNELKEWREGLLNQQSSKELPDGIENSQPSELEE